MRVLAALPLLAALAFVPQPASAQNTIMIGGKPQVKPETCVTRQSFFTRTRYGNTIQTRENYKITNRCKFPVNHYNCLTRPGSADCTRVASFRGQALRKGQSYVPYVEGGKAFIAHSCRSDEVLLDWGSDVRCGVPGSAPAADTGYRGVGTPPNRNAPSATLLNAQGVTGGMVYPPELVGKRINTTVTVAVGVNATGRPTGCVVVQTSGYHELDSLTCDLFMRRARFNQAPGAGERVYTSGRVTWSEGY
jgi:TonB family protein